MSEDVVRIDGLPKKYENRNVVDHISFNIKQGEIFGLLGPNGAGKSTTMNKICSLIKQTSGTIELFGMDQKKELRKIKPLIGYIPQELVIHGNLKIWENIKLFTALYHLKGWQLKDAVNRAIENVGLEEKRNEFAKNFSGGMKRRLNIACVMGHDPKLLIFDEPMVGIDPQSRNFILEKIKEANQAGATVIYTSHYMEEVEALCTRIAIMDHGKIIASGTKEELKRLVVDDETENISLEEVFLKLTGKKLRDYTEGGF